MASRKRSHPDNALPSSYEKGGLLLKSSTRPNVLSNSPIRIDRAMNGGQGGKKGAGVTSSMSLSTAHGGITLSRLPSSSSSQQQEYGNQEIDVLKNVVLREEYLRRLEVMIRQTRRKMPGEAAELLDMIRISSVETVEAIVRWRVAMGQADIPFLWNGVNYLLKMTSDLDFLDASTTVRYWLGFSAFRNPFNIPLPLELFPVSSLNSSNNNNAKLGGQTPTFFSSDFTDIRGGGMELSIRLRRGGGNGGGVHQPQQLRSVISDLDMQRVREAEHIILMEEANNMRFVRDANGRIIPASLAGTSFLKDALSEDERRDIRLPPVGHPYVTQPLAKYLGEGGKAEVIPEEREDRSRPTVEGGTTTSSSSVLQSGVAKSKTLKRNQRKGGALMPFNAKGTMGRKKSPPPSALRRRQRPSASLVISSAVARLPQPHQDRDQVLSALQETLDHLRKHLATAKEELRELERSKEGQAQQQQQQQHQHQQQHTRQQKSPPTRAEEPLSVGPQQPSVRQGTTAAETAQRLLEASERKKQEIESLQKQVQEQAAALLLQQQQQQQKRDKLDEEKRSHQTKSDNGKRYPRDSTRGEELMDHLKSSEVQRVSKNNALRIERKRRLLNASALEFFPEYDPGPNQLTLEDLAAIQIQRIARGRQARAYARQLSSMLHQLAILLQALVRGFLTRREHFRKREALLRITKVQSMQRARLGWKRAKKLKEQSRQQQAALHISRLIVGHHGKLRFKHRRAYVTAARTAAASVSSAQLCSADVMGLVERLAQFLRDPHRSPLPPVILGLLRIIILMLGGDCITTVSPSTGRIAPKNMKYSADIGWEDASRVLRRKNKFLRKLRILAAGPAAPRPRFLTLSRLACELYQAYQLDPAWSVETIREIGQGGQCAVQLFLYVENLMAVLDLQRHFLEEMGGAVPPWLVRHRNYCKRRRELKMEILIKERVCHVIEDALERQGVASQTSSSIEGGGGKGTSGSRRFIVWARKQLLRGEQRIKQELTQTLEELEKTEAMLRERDSSGDTAEMAFAEDKVTKLLADINEKKLQLTNAEARVESSSKHASISTLMQEIKDLELALLELNLSKEMTIIQWQRNRRFRQNLTIITSCNYAQLMYTGDITARVAMFGEAKGMHGLAFSDHEVLRQEVHRQRMENKSDIQEDVAELQVIKVRLENAQRKTEETETELEQAVADFEDALQREFDDVQAKEEAGLSLAADTVSTTEEGLEDEKEDQQLAMEETVVMTQWVPQSLIESKTFPDAPPFLLCVGRDLPSYAKTKIYEQLSLELSGSFIRVDTPHALGLNLPQIQVILRAGLNVVVDIDPGLVHRSRRQFLESLALAKCAVHPSPRIILLVGSAKNPGSDFLQEGKMHYGVGEDDLSILVDEELKRRLQLSVNCLQMLMTSSLSAPQKGSSEEDSTSSPSSYQLQLEALSRMDKPPSPAYVMVMEAIAILFTPKSYFRSPSQNISAASWNTIKGCTVSYQIFCQRLKGVDKMAILQENLMILQDYISHPDWPQGTLLLKESDSLLYYLATWVKGEIEATVLYRVGEGPAQLPDRRILGGVVEVLSAPTELGEENEASGIGWRAGYANAMEGLLQDYTVMHEAKRFNQDQIYTVGVYQLVNRIFFTAYHPETSCRYYTSIPTTDINKLLPPNSFEVTTPGWTDPPATHLEICERLVSLLSIKRMSLSHGEGSSMKRLLCRRKLQRLLREARTISGHQVVLSMFEESKGELRSFVYIPAFSVTVNLWINAVVWKTFAADLDKDLIADADSEDAQARVHPISERLALVPSWTAVRNIGYASPAVVGWGPSSTIGSILKQDVHPSFQLTVRKHAGAGQVLFQSVHKIGGGNRREEHEWYTTKCYEAGRRGVLRIQVYNQRTCITTEFRLTSLERICLLGTCNGREWMRWKPKLLEKLSLRVAAGGKQYPQARGEKRNVIALDQKVFAKMRTLPGGYILKLSIYLDQKKHHGLVLVFSINNKPSKYRKLLTWEELLRHHQFIAADETNASASSISSHPQSLEDVLIQLDHHGRQRLYHSIAKLATCSQDLEADQIILDGMSFNHLIIDKSSIHNEEEDDDDETENGRLKRSRPIDSTSSKKTSAHVLALGDRVQLQDLIDYVALSGRPLPLTTYRNEIGNTVPLSYFPPPPPRPAARRPQSARTETTKRDEDLQSSSTVTTSSSELPRQDTSSSSSLPSERKVKAETLLLNQGVKVLHELQGVKTWFANVNLRVYSSVPLTSSAAAEERRLRFVVYRPTTSASAQACVIGYDDLCEVIGSQHQHLLAPPPTEQEMLLHVAHRRLIVMEGLWNAETDKYDPEGTNAFTVLLKRDRLYKNTKETPVFEGGDADLETNKLKLIKERKQRGRKVYRCVRKVDGGSNASSSNHFLFLHFTVFESLAGDDEKKNDGEMFPSISQSDDNDDSSRQKVPHLRIISYNPQTGYKSTIVPSSEAILEVIGGPYAPILDPTRRVELARAIVGHLVLAENGKDLFLPFTGQRETKYVERARLEQVMLHLPGKLFQMSTRFPKPQQTIPTMEVIITVFQSTPEDMSNATGDAYDDGKGGEADALRLNFSCPSLGETLDLIISREEQIGLVGRPLLDFREGQRELAMRRAIDSMDISSFIDPEDPSKTRLRVNPHACKDKPWLCAYQRLNPKEAVLRDRPHGQPLVFIPSTNKGDILWRRGMQISQVDVLFTVSTKEKGLSPLAGGLVFEAYDPTTCTTSILHLGRAQLLHAVENNEALLQPQQLQDTLEAILLYRLHLSRHPVNGVLLGMDRGMRSENLLDDHHE